MGSDIEAICREATMLAIRNFLTTHTKREEAEGKPSQLKVTMSDFRQAIMKINKQKESQEQLGRISH